MANDLISRQEAINAINELHDKPNAWLDLAVDTLENLPSEEPKTCEGCRHLGKWENEVENGYSSPCTLCKRRVNDNYEKRSN